MIITLKNKDTLIIDEFRLKCCIGRGNLKKNNIEGDGSTPIGKFEIGTLYWRPDRVQKPNTKLFCKPINKNIIRLSRLPNLEITLFISLLILNVLVM